MGKANLSLAVDGPRHRASTSDRLAGGQQRQEARDEKPRTLVIDPPADRVRMQRSFGAVRSKKRLYAINVGTPAGAHYAYDFETAAILACGAGSSSTRLKCGTVAVKTSWANPRPCLTLNAKPVLALLEQYTNDWPVETDAMWSSQGYRLEPDGQPTFLFKLSQSFRHGSHRPAKDGAGLTALSAVK